MNVRVPSFVVAVLFFFFSILPLAQGAEPTRAELEHDPRPESKRLPGTTLQATPPETTSTQSSRLPVIFLPGVTGSQLFDNPPIVPGPLSQQLWPFSFFGNRSYLALRTDGKSVLGRNIFVGDIVRAGEAMFSSLSDAYGSLIEFFKARGYKEDTDLFAFPYDWRQDNKTHFDALDHKITVAKARTGKEKVILVGHSMGGLIMRAYVLSRPERAAAVDTLITLATPYWGAPKVYYSMIKGYTFGNLTASVEMMKILFQNWPAAYQLLPTERFIEELCPRLLILVFQCHPRLLTLPESYGIRYKWFKDDPSTPYRYTETVDNVLKLRQELVKLAKDFHASAGTKENSKFPTNVKLYVIIGHGISTLSRYGLRDWEPGPLEPLFPSSYLELEAGRKVTMDPYFDDGDGTVPLWCLEISGATATYYVPTRGRKGDFYAGHGSLTKNKTAQEIVGQILDNNPPDARRFAKTVQTPETLIWEENRDSLKLN